jgi:hypothetical protein
MLPHYVSIQQLAARKITNVLEEAHKRIPLRSLAEIKYPKGCDMLEEWRNSPMKTNTS